MPKRKVHATVESNVVVKKIWVVYGKQREECFAEEVKAGLFGGGCRCGCFKCEPQLKFPEHSFTANPAEESLPQ